MSFFKNMKIGTRLTAGFGVVFLLMVVTMLVASFRLSQVNEMTKRIVEKDWIKTVLANDVIDIANDNAKANMEFFLLTDKSQIAKTFERIDKNKKSITEKLDKLEAILYQEEGKKIIEKVKEARTPYVASFTKVSKLLIDEGKRDEATEIMLEETLPNLNTYISAINDLVELQGRLFEQSGVEAEEAYISGRNLMIGICLFAIIAGIAISYWITRSITYPLNKAVELTHQVSKGDMTASIEATSSDEIGQLLGSMNNMMSSLNSMASAAEKLSEGDLNAKIEIRSDKDILGKSFQKLLDTMKELIAETEQLVRWAKGGELKKRGDSSKFKVSIWVGEFPRLQAITSSIIEE